MRLLRLIAASLPLALPAWAQRPPTQTYPGIQSVPLPPLQQQWQQSGLPPVQQSPNASAAPDAPSQSGPGASPFQMPQPAAPLATAERPNIWLPAQTVRLQALDKVNAETTGLTIKVGQAARFGSLTIMAKACMVRPPDRPADAAALLVVTDSHPGAPGFDGWMLKDEPSVSMMEHPIYDLRVAGCT